MSTVGAVGPKVLVVASTAVGVNSVVEKVGNVVIASKPNNKHISIFEFNLI